MIWQVITAIVIYESKECHFYALFVVLRLSLDEESICLEVVPTFKTGQSLPSMPFQRGRRINNVSRDRWMIKGGKGSLNCFLRTFECEKVLSATFDLGPL